MPEFVRRSPMPASAEHLFAWHSRPGAFVRLQPPWEDVRIDKVDGPFADGQRVTISAGVAGPVRKTWVAELFDVAPGRQFRDRQLSGPFAEWTHTHAMTPTGPHASELEDRIEYRPPFGPLGRLADGLLIRHRLAAMFAYRHAVTASDLRRHAAAGTAPLTVAVTGSTGLVGSEVVPFLTAGGHRVVRLRRGDPEPAAYDDGTSSRQWDPNGPPDPGMLAGVDAVVHLAGENVAAGRWDAAKKARIRDSRVGPTRKLAEAAAAAGVKTLVSASAVGFYGDRGDEVLSEDSRPGTGFFPDVCREWEDAADPARDAGVRVVHPRIGVVLTPKGGALAKQLPAFRLGGGAVVGDGGQWVPWVSVNDLVGVLHFALTNPGLSGPVNAVSPTPVTNREFGRVLAKVLKRPYLLTAPAPALRLLFGELADAALLASTRVVPTKLERAGFAFDHPDLGGALRFLLGAAG